VLGTAKALSMHGHEDIVHGGCWGNGSAVRRGLIPNDRDEARETPIGLARSGQNGCARNDADRDLEHEA
jgi:hypothetical protein